MTALTSFVALSSRNRTSAYNCDVYINPFLTATIIADLGDDDARSEKTWGFLGNDSNCVQLPPAAVLPFRSFLELQL